MPLSYEIASLSVFPKFLISVSCLKTLSIPETGMPETMLFKLCVFLCFFPYLQYFLNEIVLMNFFIIIFCTNAFQLLYDSPPNIVFLKIFLNSKPFKLSSNNYFIFLVPRYWWENWCYNHDANVQVWWH